MKRGAMIVEGEHATITFEREYPHAIEHVWDAIATPEGLREWLMCSAVAIDGRVGGVVEMTAGPAQYHSCGTISRWEPPRVLEYEWRIEAVPEMPRGEHAVVCYELAPIAGGTKLVVTYRRITKQTARGWLPGTHAFLDRLEAQLAGEPLPDWQDRFVAIRADYPEWSEHASAPR